MRLPARRSPVEVRDDLLDEVGTHLDLTARMAVHGTDAERTVGDPANAGCLRARRCDVVIMRGVPVGTSVVIVP
jgi:lipoprotein-anchoring transpeptidase ErfK/SrfK